MALKIINNKDGDMPTWKGFTSYSPNTYSVVVDGIEVGGIENNPHYCLSNLNPNWGGNGKVWVYADENGEQFANQYLSAVKNWIRENVHPGEQK